MLLLKSMLLIVQASSPLPKPVQLFEGPEVERSLATLCGSQGRQCRDIQNANIALLRASYEDQASGVDRTRKIVELINLQRAGGAIDWQIVRAQYESWLVSTGKVVLPSIPRVPPIEITTKCVSRRGKNTYTTECTTTNR